VDEQTARAEEAAARQEAAAIGELVSVEELDALTTRARVSADDEAKLAKGQGALCSQVRRCRTAEETLAGLTQRLGQAKARAAALQRAEEARGRVSAAQGRAKAGPASAPLSALWIAARGGWQAEEVDANVNVGLTALMIVFTQILAWCAHPAVKCIAWGLERAERITHQRSAPAQPPVIIQPALEQAKPAPRPRKRSARTAPAAVVEQVQTWASQALISRSGAAVAAGDVFAAFQDETGAQITQAAFGAAMAEAGFNKAKRGGRVVYLGVAFRQALRLAVEA
jgi:hypothetical protein